VLGDALGAVVDGDSALQGDSDAHGLAGQCRRDAVAIAADLDLGVPADLPGLPVRRVVAARRQRLQGRRLPREALVHDLVHRAVHPRVGVRAQPVFGQLVEVRQLSKAR
jgi:hypothetical protein